MDATMGIAGAVALGAALVLMYVVLRKYTYPAVEQPFFSERLAIDTHLKLEPEKMFAFIGPSHGKDKKPLAVFITPHIIGAAPFNSIDN